MHDTAFEKSRGLFPAPELVAPAGTPAKLKTALHFGADAVYLGLKQYSMRSFAGNFDLDQLNNPDAINNFNTMLRVRYSIYSGGKVTGAVEASGYAYEAAEAGRERTRQEVVRQVVETYTGAVLASAHLEVARTERRGRRCSHLTPSLRPAPAAPGPCEWCQRRDPPPPIAPA